MNAEAKAPTIAVKGESAQHIAAIWRKLPAGSQSRCHIPPFGLRFLNGNRVVCQGSICWKCNKIYGDIRGEPFAYEFDASDKMSRALLTKLQELTDSDATDEGLDQ